MATVENRLDKEIKENTQKALDINKSVWVSASAGSGKTTILVKRILTLMLSGVDVKKIVCITYTKNGANEMKERIYKKLSSWLYISDEELKEDLKKNCENTMEITEELLQRARTMFINLIDNSDELKIFTIHSFCQQILNKFPLEAGIQPNFEIVEGEEQKELFRRAMEEFLLKSENIKYLTILDYISPKDFETVISQKSYDFNDDIFTNIFEIFFQNGFNLDTIIQQLSDKTTVNMLAVGEELLNEIFKIKEAYLKMFVNKAETVGNNIYKNVSSEKLAENSYRYKNLEKLKNWLYGENSNNKINNIKDYLMIFLTTDYETKQIKPKTPRGGCLDMDEAQNCYDFYQNYYNLESLYASMLFVAILTKIRQYYIRLKRDKILLDYEDLISITNNLLKTKESADWVRYKLDSTIEHILLDEAQDTLPTQWEIIRVLLEEFFSGETANESKRTLFVVGDEKQSIFGFQGANPALFKDNFNYYKNWLNGENGELQKIQLQYSFRSCQNIIAFVNEIFKDKENLTKITTEPTVKHMAYRQQKGYIELWDLIDVEEDKQEEIEDINWEPRYKQIEKDTKEKILADYIAEKIKSFFDENKTIKVKDNEKPRAVKYSDIMLLLTKRDDKLLSYLIKKLNSYKIPNSGFDKFNLFENIFIKDLISLLNFVVFPQDDFNLATLIKSPILNLTEEDLKKICELKNEKQLSIFEILKDYNIEKYDFLNYILEFSKNQNSYDFFIYCLEQTDIKKNIIKRAGEEFEIILADFLTFVKQFTNSSGSNLVQLLSFIKNNEYSLKKDLTNSESLNQVRITTKHSSKGSEAPIVFILDAQQGSMDEKTVFNFKMDNGTEVPLVLKTKTELTTNIKNIINNKLEEESYRLFYVAITRSCNELYICALNKGKAKTTDKDGEEKAKDENNFYHISKQALLNLGAVEKQFDFNKNLKKYCFGEIEETAVKNIQQSNIKEYKEYNENYFKLQDLSNEETMEIQSPSQFYNHSDRDFNFKNMNDNILLGNATHKLLEILPNVEENKREEVANLYFQNVFNDVKEVKKQEIKNNVFKILNDSNYKQFFSSSNSKAEVPVVGIYEGKTMSGQIDRLIEFEDKVVIIDYKNTFKDYNNRQDIPQKYIQQLQIYKTLLQKEYKNKPIECYILLTKFVKLIRVG